MQLTQLQIDTILEMAKDADLTPVEYMIEEFGWDKESATELWENS